MDYYKTLVDSKLQYMGESGKNSIYKCPMCEAYSGSGHFYVDYDKGKYNCFKCGFRGRRMVNLLLQIGYSSSSIRDYPSHLVESSPATLDSVISSLTKEEVYEKEEYSRPLGVLTEYYELHCTALSPMARSYLYRRGIDDYLINHYRISEGLSRSREYFKLSDGKSYPGRDYGGRIMIPSIYSDTLISYYVARDYLDRKSETKYKNPPQDLAFSSEDVWNLNRVNSPSVIICEGVITAIAAGLRKCNGVATYGKSISAVSNSDSRTNVMSQGEKLLSKKFSLYVVAYDADAQEQTRGACKYLSDRGANVSYILVPPIKGPTTDLSDLSYDQYVELLQGMKKFEEATWSLNIDRTSL